MRKSRKKPQNPLGKPPHAPAYDFSRHLDWLEHVLPHRRPTHLQLHERCKVALGSHSRPISLRQFVRQIEGTEPRHPRLHEILGGLVPLDDYGIAAEHWLALEQFKGALPEPGTLPSMPRELRTFLDGWHGASPMPKLRLQPESPPRLIGKDDPTVPRLYAGPHRLCWTAAPNGMSVHLLLLEHDERHGRWSCANRVKELDLSLDRPLHAAGFLPVPVMSAPGAFALFAVAAPSPFHEKTVALIESTAIGSDGAMTDEIVAAMLKCLQEQEREHQRLVGRFRYRVE